MFIRVLNGKYLYVIKSSTAIPKNTIFKKLSKE